MMPPLIYSSDQNKSFAEELASFIGTTSCDVRQMTQHCHLYLSDSGLSFFHPEARSTKKFKIDLSFHLNFHQTDCLKNQTNS